MSELRWTYHTENISEGRVIKITLSNKGKSLSFADVIQGWWKDIAFRDFYIHLLNEVPHEAVFWESPPITAASMAQQYECVVVDSSRLSSVKPNPRAFENQFCTKGSNEDIIAFENLGRDALLVVPCPCGPQRAYTHLMSFIRNGQERQKHELFQRLGEEVERRLSDTPLWISTSGLGVHWLHIRLDSFPKYYTYAPYKHI